MILIIGAPEEVHSAFMYDKITRQGGEAVYFDTRRFPSEVQIALTPGSPEEGHFREAPGKRAVPLNEFQSAYWRYFMGVDLSGGGNDPHLREMAYREVNSAMGSLFRSMDCLWVNEPDAIDMHRNKGFQLHLMKRAGVRVPETLVTNDGAALWEFYKRLEGRVIYKPVAGGAHTKLLTEEDFRPARLKELAKAPVQFQEMIPGVDIRVYGVGGEWFAAEIQSATLDFRDDPAAPIQPVELPAEVLTDCATVAKLLNLVFTGIDVRRTPDHEYVFLEGNPSPMFMHFESVTGYPISDRLIALLMAGRVPA